MEHDQSTELGPHHKIQFMVRQEVGVDNWAYPTTCHTDGRVYFYIRDGLLDYLEDRNGNGAVDSGETHWNNATDLGLKVWITQPKQNSILP